MRKKFDRKQQTNASTHAHTHTGLEHTLTLLGTITIQAYPSRLPVWQGHLPELCAIYAKTHTHAHIHTHAHAYVLCSLLVLLFCCCCCFSCSCFPLENKRRRFSSFFSLSMSLLQSGWQGGEKAGGLGYRVCFCPKCSLNRKSKIAGEKRRQRQ